jgi:hypothetical protein
VPDVDVIVRGEGVFIFREIVERGRRSWGWRVPREPGASKTAPL